MPHVHFDDDLEILTIPNQKRRRSKRRYHPAALTLGLFDTQETASSDRRLFVPHNTQEAIQHVERSKKRHKAYHLGAMLSVLPAWVWTHPQTMTVIARIQRLDAQVQQLKILLTALELGSACKLPADAASPPLPVVDPSAPKPKHRKIYNKQNQSLPKNFKPSFYYSATGKKHYHRRPTS